MDSVVYIENNTMRLCGTCTYSSSFRGLHADSILHGQSCTRRALKTETVDRDVLSALKAQTIHQLIVPHRYCTVPAGSAGAGAVLHRPGQGPEERGGETGHGEVLCESSFIVFSPFSLSLSLLLLSLSSCPFSFVLK